MPTENCTLESKPEEWDGTEPHPFASYAPYKFKQEERELLQVAYNTKTKSDPICIPEDVWLELNVLLTEHITRRAEWESDEPSTRIEAALTELDDRLQQDIYCIQCQMFNNWLAPQFKADQDFWVKIIFQMKESRARVWRYRNQLRGKRFRRPTKRKLNAETTRIMQNIFDRNGLSLVVLGDTRFKDVRRNEFLAAFFKIADDPIDETQERTLLTSVAKEIRKQKEMAQSKRPKI